MSGIKSPRHATASLTSDGNVQLPPIVLDNLRKPDGSKLSASDRPSTAPIKKSKMKPDMDFAYKAQTHNTVHGMVALPPMKTGVKAASPTKDIPFPRPSSPRSAIAVSPDTDSDTDTDDDLFNDLRGTTPPITTPTKTVRKTPTPVSTPPTVPPVKKKQTSMPPPKAVSLSPKATPISSSTPKAKKKLPTPISSPAPAIPSSALPSPAPAPPAPAPFVTAPAPALSFPSPTPAPPVFATAPAPRKNKFPPGRFGTTGHRDDIIAPSDEGAFVDLRLQDREPSSAYDVAASVVEGDTDGLGINRAKPLNYDDVKKADANAPTVPGAIPVPEGHVQIDTSYGSFIVPKYEEMSEEEQQRHRATFELRFQILNETWNSRGISFKAPQPTETVTNIHVRYKQSVKYIMVRSGVDMWKWILIAMWAGVELMCCKMGLKASGYLQSQVQMYEIYNAQLIEMGELTGFGEGWPAWLKILVISLVNALIFIFVNSCINGGGGASTPLMKLMAQFISGSNPMVTTDSDGNVKPADVNPLAGLKIGGLDIGGLFSAFTGGLGGGAAKPPPPAGAGGTRPRRHRTGPTHRAS